MSEYREIQGAAVQSLASSTGTIEGQIWYDNVNAAFKLQALGAASWASGGNISNARYVLGGAGTQTAGLIWGGRNTPIFSDSQEYDGSTWTAGGSYPKDVSSQGGTGLQTAALSVGGANPPGGPTAVYDDSFEYNGTSWGSPAAIGRGGFGMRVSGSLTAAVSTGGGSTGSTDNTDTELYDGTTWTAGNSFSTGRSFHATGGVNQTSSIIVGGRTNNTETATTAVEEYDGTSWAAGGAYPVAIKENAGWGTVNDYIQAGGSAPSAPGATNAVALYDGTAWTAGTALPGNLTLNATSQGATGTQSGFVVGGSNGPTVLNATTEWTEAQVETKTITVT